MPKSLLLNRRAFIGGGLVTSALSFGSYSLAQSGLSALPIIPMQDLTAGIEGRIGLRLGQGRHDFGNGMLSETLGINGNYLGPLLRVKQGQTLPIDVQNDIGDVSTLHWHGLHIPGEVDGGPHQEIENGAVWSPDVPITQHASMNWFHSHTHGKTAEQTYRGLAGVMLVEDDASLSADLPSTYGLDDFTLVLQDKSFARDGKLDYFVSGEVFEDGFMGDTLVVNGAIGPVAQVVPSGLIRLRILNASNARFMKLSLETGPLHVIASDGGFLPSTVQTDSVIMSPGERYEILVDMQSLDENTLRVTYNDWRSDFLGGLFASGELAALKLIRGAETGFTGSMPQRLANLAPAAPQFAVNRRQFVLNMEDEDGLAALAAAWGNICGAGGMGINGRPMNMDQINERVSIGDYEIWQLWADDNLHPFHIHGCSFRILSQNGAVPPAYAQGWKDMVEVGNDGMTEVLVRFDHAAPEHAPYMYHCHILEHEDCGMMGQFTTA